jgi:cysteinyl-tRNA synthetase
MGRPGWHIECSAMGLRYLGAGFDVHGGGRDLIFPHHENEIAQAEAAGLPFARVWMHNGMIRNEAEKMAKSVGNIFLLREVLDRYEPAVVLMYFLTTHYRSPLEFSVEKLDEAAAAYGRLRDALDDLRFRVGRADRAAARGEWPDLTLRAETARIAFADQMDDDLNTAGALGELFALVGETHRYLAAVDRGELPLDTEALTAVREVLEESLAVLLVPLQVAGAELTGVGSVAGETGAACVTGEMALLPAERMAEEGRWDDVALVYADRLACGDASYACVLRDHFRSGRAWAEADRLRDELQAAGFEVRDTPQGTQVVHRG